MPNFWQQAKAQISAGALAPALDLLAQSVGEGLQNEVILYKANLVNLEREERLFAADTGEQRDRLILRILNFIDANQTREQKKPPTDFKSMRKEKLIQRQLSAYQLLEEWEQKFELSENPNERKRSEMEIDRLKKIITKYTEELNSL